MARLRTFHPAFSAALPRAFSQTLANVSLSLQLYRNAIGSTRTDPKEKTTISISKQMVGAGSHLVSANIHLVLPSNFLIILASLALYHLVRCNDSAASAC